MPEPQALKERELIAMVAGLSGLNAISIDLMLPALPQMASGFQLANSNDQQLIVLLYMATFGVSQLIYGPLADAFGRRRALIGGLGLYVIGTRLCVFAPRFELLLAGRIL